ncbi:flagellar assembly protein A [Clostridium drakei]|uniref:RNA-binding protein KhpB N-terminal domain-containing protein n=1 Tax=Clostridium drakei TaxID=332101 RepID=A0A2U8DN92_9CLOT|nr:flagellar assembly protein A [Clostridium drakei]AWI03652.1 hypothetical protein B9W14_03855 [Clostridium drakei]
MKKVYEESSLEKCIKKACEEFSVNTEQLKFKVLDEKKYLFRKRVTVEIELPDDIKIEGSKQDEEDKETENDNENLIIDENDGIVKIVDGKIVVKNPKENGSPASIAASDSIKVFIDGEQVRGKKEVFVESKIEVFFEESKAQRQLKISLSDDAMEAYATIIYKPENIYKLKDISETTMAVLKAEVIKRNSPPRYNIEELKQELSNNNVVYGIIEENLKSCVENPCKNFVVARGQQVENGKNDFVEIKFNTDEDLKKLKEDKVGNIDFKSIGSVAAVEKGDLIGEIHSGDEGKDGCDVNGRIKKHKPGKKLKIKVGEGCTSSENLIFAAIAGKPCIKNNAFYVYPIHEVRSDVDLKTGNIKFMGDIIIYGSVKEGMKVECGNSLAIEKDVERANIRSNGDINVKGNVIAAEIFAGGEDVSKLKTIKDLESFKETLSNLVSAVEEIKKFNLLGPDKKDGEIIKILIENKFKTFSRLCINVIADLNSQLNNYEEENLVKLIKTKLIGIAPIGIQHYSILYKIVEAVEEKLIGFQNDLSIPVNIKLSYCQDSNVQSSGDVVISGKGEYISNIIANGNIYFMQERSVARGGSLNAKNEIKCRIVGSTAGVSTKLKVEKDGHIWIDEAYQNTVLLVGNREYVLDMPSRGLHAYLDSSGDIIVDKLKL